MRNDEIARTLRELYDRLTLMGEPVFKIAAYKKASEMIDGLPTSIAKLSAGGRLQELDGIGPGIAKTITELVDNGTCEALEEARQAIPEGLLELVSLPGVGKGKAQKIWDEVGAATFADVVDAAADGRVAAVGGIGASIVEVIKSAAADEDGKPDETVSSKGLLRDKAKAVIDALRTFIEELGSSDTAHLWATGDYATGCELVDDLSVLVAANNPQTIENDLKKILGDAGWEADEAGLKFTAPNGVEITITFVAHEAAALQFVADTAAETFTTELKKQVGSKPLPIVSSSELPDDDFPDRKLFEAIGKQYIPAELRHLEGAFLLPSTEVEELVEVSDLKAELHCHSKWSDGRATILDMAKAALAQGDTYMVMTDHSAPYALVNGLDGKRLKLQSEEISEVNAELAGEFTVLRGSEVEILADGTLGLADDVLAELDWVVASIHMGQKQKPDVIKARMEKVMRNPLVDCIGHPSSRVQLRRGPTALDIEWLIEIAAETGVVLEINANPQRLDLHSDHARKALAAGVRVAIDSDAHQTGTLEFREHGVSVARRAGAKKSEVVNCLEMDALLSSRRRERSTAAMV